MKALEEMHEALAKVLLQKIKNGEVTAAELNVARQFLKDNGIDATQKPGSPIDNLATSLPFSDGEPTYTN